MTADGRALPPSVLVERSDPFLRITVNAVELPTRTYFYPSIRAVSVERLAGGRHVGYGLLLTGCAIEVAVYGFGRLFQKVFETPSIVLPWFALPTILLGLLLIGGGLLTLTFARKMFRVHIDTLAGEAEILRTRDRTAAQAAFEAVRDAVRQHAGYDLPRESRRTVTTVDNPAFASPASHSAFISYHTADEIFAKAIRDSLMTHGVKPFLFRDDAVPGQRLHEMMWEAVNHSSVVLLICSRASLVRPGVRNEIQETFAREAREGGLTRLIPLTLDDAVYTSSDELAFRIRDRIVLDFSGMAPGSVAFEQQCSRLVRAIRAK